MSASIIGADTKEFDLQKLVSNIFPARKSEIDSGNEIGIGNCSTPFTLV